MPDTSSPDDPPWEPQPEYNWALIEAEYKAGVVPVPTIAMKYRVSVYRIEKEAKLHNWMRLPPPVSDEVVAAAYDLSVLEVFDPEFLRKVALQAAASIVTLHRQDIAKLRNNEMVLQERLTLFLAGKPVALPFKIDRESPAEMLEKLSRVMQRRIELERQSYGLATFDPGAKDVEERVSDELKQLLVRIDEVTAGKAASASMIDVTPKESA